VAPDLATALSEILRSVVRDEFRAAFADHRERERERDATQLLRYLRR
jgi:hypothetical protein